MNEMDLFAVDPQTPGAAGSTPLPARIRPTTLEEVVGQDHVIGPGKLLRRAIEADRLGSIILYGPPGSGKTTLAEVIARTTNKSFERSSGVLANVASLRAQLEGAVQRKLMHGIETILFIDEIHRFNKSQQDVLLPQVEDGTVTLIGATTHNPFFFINSPLTSRSLVVELEALSEEAIVTLLQRAVTHERGLRSYAVEADEDALQHLAIVCEGDARRALNALEIAALTTPLNDEGKRRITRAVAEDSIQKKAVVYDHDEDGHYDTISAFIKSVRGSDPHAALYWLGKMLVAGEDPRFVARRLVILASEDIGNADPRGLTVAVAAMHAVEFVGMPEARINLAQATTYLATAPKSNASYLGIDKAMDDVNTGRVLPVPKPLRGASYKGAEQLGHHGYVYPHDYAGHIVDQTYMPTSAIYYEPTDQGYEETIARRMEQVRAVRGQAMIVNETKQAIRTRMLEQRRSLQPEWVADRSDLIHDTLASWAVFQDAAVVSCYIAMPDEPQTSRILETCRREGKEIYVPAFDQTQDGYRLARLGGNGDLVPGQMKVPEPAQATWLDQETLDLMILPGVAFDANGGRLGHGKGHIDALVARYRTPRPVTLGLAFEFQICPEVPMAKHDARLDYVITEGGFK